MFMIAQAVQITQATVIAILAASTVVVVSLIALIAYFASRTPTNQEGGPLHFGNFFVVSLGILAALIGFLIAFPLVVSGVFTDPTQVIALLSGLFGTIVGLVGTYFGVKSSGDASQRAQELAKATMVGALPETTPDGTVAPVAKAPHEKAPPTPPRRREALPRTGNRNVGAKLRHTARFRCADHGLGPVRQNLYGVTSSRVIGQISRRARELFPYQVVTTYS